MKTTTYYVKQNKKTGKWMVMLGKQKISDWDSQYCAEAVCGEMNIGGYLI